MSKRQLLNSSSVLGDLKLVIVDSRQITIMIAACHVMLAVPVVLGCHFVLSRTKQMDDVTRQTVWWHALGWRGDISRVFHSCIKITIIFRRFNLHTLLYQH